MTIVIQHAQDLHTSQESFVPEQQHYSKTLAFIIANKHACR